MRSLIIVADDFGIGSERNHGIIKSIQEGIVTAMSLMVNGNAAMVPSLSSIYSLLTLFNSSIACDCEGGSGAGKISPPGSFVWTPFESY